MNEVKKYFYQTAAKQMVEILNEHQYDAHYAEELSISALASLCYFSEYHFMRFFKRFMGTSCLNYIKNLRLEKAAELLGQDGLTPLGASLSAGFHNLSYFYREFRKKYGVTPGDFRGAGAREK